MLFTIIILLLVGVIAYFHTIGGFFSALISAVCAIFAASLALGYHETLVEMLLGGRAADYAHAMILVGLFAALYLVFRLIFDGFVPGNITVPFLFDKIGSAVCGLIAALFATGVFAVAAQQLPFGPSIAGYSRMAVGGARDVTLSLPGLSTRIESKVYDEMEENQIDPAKQKSIPLLAVDDLLVGFVNKQSSGGALAGVRSMPDVHPDYLLELFGQRAGIQAGAKRVAYNTASAAQVELAGVYRITAVPQMQGELEQLKDLGLSGVLRGSDSEPLIVVRTKIDVNTAGENGKFRFSLGSVRMKITGRDGEDRNVWPLGTLEDGNLAFISRPDDFLAMPTGKSMVDLIFRVPGETIVDGKIAEGTFVEVKRMARVDLSGQDVKGDPPLSPQVGLQWKAPVVASKSAARAAGAAGGAGRTPEQSSRPPTTDAAIVMRGEPRASEELPTAVNVATGDSDASNLQFGGGTGTLRGKKFSAFKIDGSLSITRIAAGEFTVKQLAAPSGKKVVQITGDPNRGDAWQWADLSKFELEDSTGAKHKPNGGWAKLAVGTGQHFIGAYDADKPVGEVQQIEGRPTEVTLAFVLPAGTKLAELRYDGKVVSTLTFTVP